MSIKPVFQGLVERLLEADAETYGVRPTTIAKAIVEVVEKEGLADTILAGIDLQDFEQRHRGRPKVKLYEKPKKVWQPKYFYRGMGWTLEALSVETGIPPSTIRNRLKAGLSMEEALRRRDRRRS